MKEVSRRKFLSGTTVVLGLMAGVKTGLSFSPVYRKKSRKHRPNILLAISDDQSWCFTGISDNCTARTPGFNRIAREGVLFTHAFSAAPSCTPARGALLTGQDIWRLEEGGNLRSTLPAKFDVYPDLLEASGYAVGYTGKGWAPGLNEPGGRKRNPAGLEFNEIAADVPRRVSCIDYAANFEAFLASRSNEQPFCFWFGCHEPHRSYRKGSGVKAGKRLKDVRVPKFLPDVPDIRSDLLDYEVEIEWFDSHLCRMIKMLEDAGELDNTVVVVTSDNGMPFPRGKVTLYDYGIRVPLAIRWPERIKPGRVVNDFIGFVDFAPMFLELAGLKPTAEMTGRSFLDLLASDVSGWIDPSRDRVFSGMERHAWARVNQWGYPMRTIRTRDYLYIRNYEPDRWPSGDPERWWKREVYNEIDPSPTKAYMMAHRDEEEIRPLFRLAFEKRPKEELYDIARDPYQMNNVINLPEYASAKDMMSDALEKRLIQSEDPRALGKKPLWDLYPMYNYKVNERIDDGTGWKLNQK